MKLKRSILRLAYYRIQFARKLLHSAMQNAERVNLIKDTDKYQDGYWKKFHDLIFDLDDKSKHPLALEIQNEIYDAVNDRTKK